MAARPRNRAGMDAEAVARMMAAQDAEPEPEATPQPVPGPEAAEPAEALPPAIIAAPEPAAETAPEVDSEPSSETGAVASAEPDFFDAGKVDGRTLRRTGREPFATRIKPEAHAALRRIAYARGITMAEALELAVAAYERRKKPEGRKPPA